MNKFLRKKPQTTDSQQMFGTLMRAFVLHIPRSTFGDIRRLVTLAWAVVGLTIGKTANFNKWGESVISKATIAASHQRRFQRWLHNKHILPNIIYAPLLKAALQDWDLAERLFVSLDTSVLPGGYVLIRAALVYRGRAIPVAWNVIKHGSASVSFDVYKSVLEQVLAALPAGCSITWLADRGFLHSQFVKFIKQRPEDHYRIRAKANTRVRFADRCVVNMLQLCPPEGHAHFYHDIKILNDSIGMVHVAMGNPADAEEPWYIISDEYTDLATFDEYGLRFDIEENFLDDKSNGFDVESSRLDNAEALSRLFLILAIATLYYTSVGTAVVKQGKRRIIDTHWDRGMSYFKIGWEWVRQQFRKKRSILPPFQLDSTPDPEPAIASRRKAAKPKRQWAIAHFCLP
jgi:hypothetical protein